jgi:hypothetical protein
VAEAFPGIESIGISVRLADGTSDEAMKFVVASSAMGSLATLARAEAGDYGWPSRRSQKRIRKELKE